MIALSAMNAQSRKREMLSTSIEFNKLQKDKTEVYKYIFDLKSAKRETMAS